MNGGGVNPRPTPPTPQETLYYITLSYKGQDWWVICNSQGAALVVNKEGEDRFLSYGEEGEISVIDEIFEDWESYPSINTGIDVKSGESFNYGGYSFTPNEDEVTWSISPAIERLQRPLYSHEYTFGNYITNGERNESNNMKAAYITIGSTVQVFKENTTAGKWETGPNSNNLALMNAPIASFEAGPPSDFTYEGFTFTFQQGEVDGYIVTPALSII